MVTDVGIFNKIFFKKNVEQVTRVTCSRRQYHMSQSIQQIGNNKIKVFKYKFIAIEIVIGFE